FITMSEMGELYKLAEDIVLQNYDMTGQHWKTVAIREDRRLGRDSRTLQTFAEDVEAKVNQLTVKKSSTDKQQTTSVSSSSHTVAAEPIAPASPHNPS